MVGCRDGWIDGYEFRFRAGLSSLARDCNGVRYRIIDFCQPRLLTPGKPG
jgi:hypothetical protein